jgi:hypothetical protein
MYDPPIIWHSRGSRKTEGYNLICGKKDRVESVVPGKAPDESQILKKRKADSVYLCMNTPEYLNK